MGENLSDLQKFGMFAGNVYVFGYLEAKKGVFSRGKTICTSLIEGSIRDRKKRQHSRAYNLSFCKTLCIGNADIRIAPDAYGSTKNDTRDVSGTSDKKRKKSANV